MRKLTGAAFVSIDGVMQAPGGPTEDPTGGFDQGGWMFGVNDDVIDRVLVDLSSRPTRWCLGGVPSTSSQHTGLSLSASWLPWRRR
jgi:hypothetical protein